MRKEKEHVVVETISTKEARKMLRVTENTFASFVKRVKIRRVSSDSDPLNSVLWNKDDFRSALKINKLPDKFLTTPEVARILQLKESQVVALCYQNLIPCYKINVNQGSPILYVKEEILEKKVLEISLEKHSKYHGTAWRYKEYQLLVSNLLAQAKKINVFSERSFNVVSDLLLGERTIEELCEKYELSTNTITRIFTEKFERLVNDVSSIYERLLASEEENKKLIHDNKFLIARLAKYEDFNSKPLVADEAYVIDPDMLKLNIEDLDISRRAKNSLGSADIETLEDLLSWTEHDLLKIRNFGEGSLISVNKFLTSKNLKLKKYKKHPLLL
ncbi:MAG: DNA-directed RNA polymerase subunit alpha C-terminal domain-containing protein [Patescibacteria group bacterium]